MTSPMFVAPQSGSVDEPVVHAKSIARSAGTTSPLTLARRVVDLSLRGEATASEMAWLQDNPVLWLRALSRVREETESHIAKSRATVGQYLPAQGERSSPEHLAAVREHKRNQKARMHFLEILKCHVDEVKTLCGFDIPDATMRGDFVNVLVDIATLIDTGETQNARRKALAWAERISKAGAS